MAITDDNINEEDEQFSGELTLPAGSLGVTLGASTAVATIIDNDRKYIMYTCGTLVYVDSNLT